MRAIYTADTEGVVAVAAAATVVVFGGRGDTNHAIDLLGYGFSIDQATPTATDKSVLVEFCACTFATNDIGTNSTAVSVDQESGPRLTEQFTFGRTWTAVPTVITSLKPFDCDPYKFTYEKDPPFGESPDFALGQGFVFRVTNPTGNSSVNVRAWARFAHA
jgi:hypothetical protein